jgi:hypothetical protein
VGGGDDVGVGLGGERRVRRRGRVEPVAELEAAGPEPVLAGQAGQPVDPAAHARQLPGEHLGVAGALVDHPRHDRRRVAPRRRRGTGRAEDVRDDERHGTVLLLVGRQVLEPGGEEAGAVVEEAGGR